MLANEITYKQNVSDVDSSNGSPKGCLLFSQLLKTLITYNYIITDSTWYMKIQHLKGLNKRNQNSIQK